MPEEKNVFGQTIKDGKVVEPTAPVASVVDTAKKDDKGAGAPDDIEKHPLVVELRGQIATIKKEYGGNLSGQRGTIERLEKRIEDITKASKEEKKPEPLYKDIKRVKDLPKEERDAMSETERRLFDELADMKERSNEAHAAQQTKQEEKPKDANDGAGFDVNAAVQAEAMKLADGNYTKAMELIGKFNSLNFDLTKIDSENVVERVASVVALIPDWKPKKEQETGGVGAAVKEGKASTGVDAAVAAAVQERTQTQSGNYAL